jgi:hypothetical protein
MSGEEWRKVPGVPYQLSNFGRMRNTYGRMVTPRLPLGALTVRYEIKSLGVRKVYYVKQLMAKIWPEVSGVFGENWVARTREANGLPAEPRHVLEKRAPVGFTGWANDPWDTMHLWDQGRDYRNYAQYVPVF